MIAMAGNRRVIISSKLYRDWHQEQVLLLQLFKRNYVLDKPVDATSIEITFYPPDRMRGDLTNKAESVMDLMVDCGILEDDNWFVVSDLSLRLGSVDKSHPRVEICIKEREDEIRTSD
jgi:Holliday junction resolvase RusA-like endonuclease